MAVSVTFNGSTYLVPVTNEVGWGSNVTDYLTAISQGCLQNTGGSFTLSAETDFGASYGLKSLYYKSRTANVASAGQLRLASADVINFRNNANGADISIAKDASDNLQWNSKKILLSGDVVNVDINASAAIAYSKLSLTGGIVNADVNASAAIVRSKLAATESSDVTYASGKGLFLTDGTSNTIKVTAPTAVTTYALKMPTAQGGANQYLTNDGSGNLSWTNAAGTGTVNSGTATNLGFYATSTNAISNAGDLYYDSTNHTLGVGVASGAGVPLTVKNLAAATSKVVLDTAGTFGTHASYLSYKYGGAEKGRMGFITNDQNFYVANDTANSVIVYTNGSPALTLDSSQNATFGGRVLTPNGAAAAPAYTFPTHTGSGLYMTDTPTIGISIAGVSALAFDISQNATFTGTVDTAHVTHSTGVAIKGTTTNSSATAGDVGETIGATAGPVNLPTSNTYGDLASISLTAGDWLVTGVVNTTLNSATCSNTFMGVSTTSGNSGTGLVLGDNLAQGLPPTASADSPLTIPAYHMLLAGSVTVYLKYGGNYSGGPPRSNGRISAVRIR